MSTQEPNPNASTLQELGGVLLGRINSIEPENTTRIMGYMFIHFAEDDLMQLAFGPEILLRTVVLKAKSFLELSGNSESAIPDNNVGQYPSIGFSTHSPSPFSRPPNSAIAPHSSNSAASIDYPSNDLSMDGLMHAHFHRRSYSTSDACQGLHGHSSRTESRPCLYYYKGFCKNGNNCKFAHRDTFDHSGNILASSSKCDEIDLQKEILSGKASQLSRSFAVEPQFPDNKEMGIFLKQQYDSQRSAALWAKEEMIKLGRLQFERSDFLALGFAENGNPASRQIYLTFPSDSNFKDDDVSEYFSKFGPVQDVRIPYQQKRMFGFVTFHYPETVKRILQRGNPHFICDSRVLVKPYKEMGKVEDRRLHKETEKGGFSTCLSPSSLDCRESFDLSPVAAGPRSLHNAHGMRLRRKLEEQAYLKQVIDQQSRKLMNLQVPDLKNDYTHHHQRSLSVGTYDISRSEPPIYVNQNAALLSDNSNKEVAGDNRAIQVITMAANKQQFLPINNGIRSTSEGNSSLQEDESLDHLLPCDLLSSPTNSENGVPFAFSNALAVTDENPDILFSASSQKNQLLATTSTTKTQSHRTPFS